MASPVIVSGADKTYFVMACLLMRSLARWAPDLPFYCLDFGLDDAQRRFLRDRGNLIERPAHVPATLHPIIAKTAIGEYLRAHEWSSVLWLDSDMLAIGPLQDSLADVLTSMAAGPCEVAACSVETISELLAGGWPMAPFVEALRTDQIDLELAYYNNGTVVFRSHEFLDAWWQLAQRTPVHLCIDQNLFNLLALRRGGVMPLRARIWNLHGAMLGDATAVTVYGRQRIAAGERNEPALILHPTSIRDQHHVAITSKVGRGPGQVVKLFRNPALRQCQIEAITALIAEAGEALAQAGVEHPAALLEAADAHFPSRPAPRDPNQPQTWGKVGRLEPCPCGSGKRYKHCHGVYV